jgi:hypothetical protein
LFFNLNHFTKAAFGLLIWTEKEFTEILKAGQVGTISLTVLKPASTLANALQINTRGGHIYQG